MSGKVITVSYSELDTFRQCPLKHRLAYIDRWTKEARPGGPLARGSLWHQVLQAHYVTLAESTRGRTRTEIKLGEKTILEYCRRAVEPLLVDTRSGEQTEDQELIAWMYAGYVEFHGADADWKILGVEFATATPLVNEFEVKTRFRLKVKIDLIVQSRTDGTRWLIDHKSGANLPSDMELDIDDQFGLYEFVLNRIQDAKGKPRFTGSLHNAARTQRNKSFMPLETRMSRTPMNRTEIELRNIEIDAVRTAQAAYSARNLKTPHSSPDPRQCGWKCDFLNPHLIARKGGDLRTALVDYNLRQDFTRH